MARNAEADEGSGNLATLRPAPQAPAKATSNDAAAASGVTGLNATDFVDVCRVLDVPVSMAMPGALAVDDGRQLQRELLELTRAYTCIQDASIRTTLLQLAKAAARQA